MEALLRASFTHRTPEFWGWLLLLAVSLATIELHLPRLLGNPAQQAQGALQEGQRVIIALADGHLTGRLAPPTNQETAAPPSQPSPPKNGEKASRPSPMPESAAPAKVEPADAPAPDGRAPSARIPPRAQPEVRSQELTPPTDGAVPKNALPAASGSPAHADSAPSDEPTSVPVLDQAPATPPLVSDATDSGPTEKSGGVKSVKTLSESASTPDALPVAARDVKRPLREAPQTALLESTDAGLLPRTAPNGASPMRAYAKTAPAAEADSPRIALVLLQVGLNPAWIEAAMALPEDVSLSVSPYADKSAGWISMARTRGHEALLDLPMEPKDFPISDAGPAALSPREQPEENLARLRGVLTRAQGYVGLVATANEHFLPQSARALPVLKEIGQRGLLLVADNPSAALSLGQTLAQTGLPNLGNSLPLDASGGEEAFLAQLRELEQAAQKQKRMIGLLRPSPLALRVLGPWMAEAGKRGLVFVPVSALLPPVEAKQAATAPASQTAAEHGAH